MTIFDQFFGRNLRRRLGPGYWSNIKSDNKGEPTAFRETPGLSDIICSKD